MNGLIEVLDYSLIDGLIDLWIYIDVIGLAIH